MDFSGAVDLGKKTRTSVVEETNIGIYVWEMPDGSIVQDEDGNIMNIPGKKGDRKRMLMLEAAAKAHGIYEGAPLFYPGHRRITEEEYQQQRERLQLGLVPDPEDAYSQLDEIRNAKYKH